MSKKIYISLIEQNDFAIIKTTNSFQCFKIAEVGYVCWFGHISYELNAHDLEVLKKGGELKVYIGCYPTCDYAKSIGRIATKKVA